MNKILKIIGTIFTIIGLLLIIFGLYFYNKDNLFKNSSIKTEGVVSKKTDSDIFVEFYVQGKKYSGSINYYSSNIYEGDRIKIYYDPSNPNIFQGEGSYLYVLIFGIIGSTFLLIGGIVIIFLIYKKRKIKRIIGYNYRISATIIGVTTKYSVRINGKNPYILEANYMSLTDGKLYNFESEFLFRDITPILEKFNISEIPVYINPNNYNEYVMDISQIKQYLGN